MNWAAAALTLAAGVLAYLGYAAGDSGPMAVFGTEDALENVRDASMQLPFHAGIAVAVLASRLRRAWDIPRLVALVSLGWASFLWMIALTVLVVAGIPQRYADLLDVAWAASVLGAYAAVAFLLLRVRRKEQ